MPERNVSTAMVGGEPILQDQVRAALKQRLNPKP
jgi:hypothetical protein